MQRVVRHKPARRAFTLTELLAVVAVIGIILTLLSPAYKRAIQAANSSRCVSNLRQLGTGILQYAADNDGSFPQNTKSDQLNPNGDTGYCWDVQIRSYVGVTSEEGSGAATTVKGPNIYYCPAGKPCTKIPNGMSRGYAYNQYVSLNQYGLGRTAGVRQPSKLGLLFEIYISLAWSSSYQESEQWYGGAGYGNYEEVYRSANFTSVKPGLVYRHNKAMNVLFADGHVGSTTINPVSLYPKDVVWYWNNNVPIAD